MRSGTPRVWVAALLAVGVCLATAALALACHPAASITLTPSVGSAGSTTTVTGRTFIPGENVSLGWNGAGGTALGSAVVSSSGTFSVTIQIPNAPADTYTVVAHAPGAPSVGAASSFTIPDPEPAPGKGLQNGSPAPAPATPGAPTGSGGQPGSAGAISGSTSGGDAAGNAGSSTRTAAGAERGGSAQRSGRQNAAGDRGVATLPSGTRVFADSIPRSGAPGPAGHHTSTTSGRPGAGPTGRSAADDLWSGFASSSKSPLEAGSAARPADGTGGLPLVSLALLGLGVSMVLAGVGVAGTRRRRAPAQALDR